MWLKEMKKQTTENEDRSCEEGSNVWVLKINGIGVLRWSPSLGVRLGILLYILS
jgi:hypothetical protein